jgi:membrane protein DedA with SNARE-associated domain
VRRDVAMWIAIAIAVGTLTSEDAALVGAAGLARAGTVSPLLAGTAVALGIWVGDAGLFFIGRLVSRWAPVARYVDQRWPRTELQALAARLERGAMWAILLSRVLPGTRVPLYIAAGAFRLRLGVFLACTAAAVTLWTGAIVLGAQWLR